jgi:N-acetylglucosamine kinase-like BadF-type ATPase
MRTLPRVRPLTFLGIDGGGSGTTARLEDGAGSALFERSGGPTNPRTTPFSLLCDRFDALLTGCPEPVALAVCLAGMRSAEMRDRMGGYFSERFPSAALRLEPDYVAALRCFNTEPATCVIAGTGSLVCSRDRDGDLVTSGGTGYLLGDEGSAYALGRRVIARYVEDSGSVDELGPAIARALGARNPDGVIAAVYWSDSPAMLLAQAAPILCDAADDGREWALALVSDEMSKLADLVKSHLARHVSRDRAWTVGLVGGVWTSEAARSAFERDLRDRALGVTIESATRSPARAAVLLARELAP